MHRQNVAVLSNYFVVFSRVAAIRDHFHLKFGELVVSINRMTNFVPRLLYFDAVKSTDEGNFIMESTH